MDENPLIVLMEFCRLQNLRLVDMFNHIDTDNSRSLTYDEFVEGLKVSYWKLLYCAQMNRRLCEDCAWRWRNGSHSPSQRQDIESVLCHVECTYSFFFCSSCMYVKESNFSFGNLRKRFTSLCPTFFSWNFTFLTCVWSCVFCHMTKKCSFFFISTAQINDLSLLTT